MYLHRSSTKNLCAFVPSIDYTLARNGENLGRDNPTYLSTSGLLLYSDFKVRPPPSISIAKSLCSSTHLQRQRILFKSSRQSATKTGKWNDRTAPQDLGACQSHGLRTNRAGRTHKSSFFIRQISSDKTHKA